MKKRTILFICISACLIFIAGFAGFLAYRHYWNVSFEASGFSASSDALNNPYCGWYNMYGYMLTASDPSALDDKIGKDMRQSSRSSHRLALLEINLNQFAGGELPESAISQLDHIFSLWESGSQALIVRFLYDWDGKALTSEPGNISIIMKHMEQCAQVVNSHAASVYIVQGIFVGNHAEMHHSNYMSEESMRALAAHLDSLLDRSIYMAVRTPAHLRAILGSSRLTAETLYGAGRARIGLFNDGMLGSSTDTGTYGDASSSFSEENYSAKGNREQELDYQNEACQLVPNGGEVIIDNAYNDSPNAIEALDKMHVSYLNAMYDQKVTGKWAQDTYTGDDCFNGVSAYDYITAHLGYRYVFLNASVSYKAFGQEAVVSAALTNTGFSPAYRPLDVTLRVFNGASALVYEETRQYDPTAWLTGIQYELPFSLPVGSLGSGDYIIYCSITDSATNEQIQPGNQQPCGGSGICLGQLHISK